MELLSKSPSGRVVAISKSDDVACRLFSGKRQLFGICGSPFLYDESGELIDSELPENFSFWKIDRNQEMVRSVFGTGGIGVDFWAAVPLESDALVVKSVLDLHRGYGLDVEGFASKLSEIISGQNFVVVPALNEIEWLFVLGGEQSEGFDGFLAYLDSLGIEVFGVNRQP